MLVGDVIQFQIILSRHSTSANMRNPISTHTVDLNNTNKAQLINDLDQWIGRYGKKIQPPSDASNSSFIPFTLGESMNKNIVFYFWYVFLVGIASFMLSSCKTAISTNIPTPQSQFIPTPTYYVPPSDIAKYKHYTPSEAFKFHLEFDYPSYWLLQEKTSETGTLSLLLRDSRFGTLPTPFDDSHPAPNDFGSVFIWNIPSAPGQSPDAEVNFLKKSYGEINRMKVLRDYKITLDGYDASVLEYQVNDQESSPSLMFERRTYFMIKDQMYEIIFGVAEKDRSGEFEQGYDYFINSLKIVP